ncbi:hypothetical protein HYH03_010151 [Edaphochlamys debaryana]|uniref:Uncharacterized protein n=1 Tax=Edaphochlamys debaryana TaxID=47281 RepID=A0A835Y5T9_9CHLO|nr:hypothetical protein HYH03_010151 [Edaphochlamys debaryana]|eukprot:KAG2491584.1 hypothetical protein HYH03_010151 [Edaphochlamys debaryana]
MTIEVVQADAEAIFVSGEGTFSKANFSMSLRNTAALCQAVMTDECLTRLGPNICAYRTMERYNIWGWYERYVEDYEAAQVAALQPRLPPPAPAPSADAAGAGAGQGGPPGSVVGIAAGVAAGTGRGPAEGSGVLQGRAVAGRPGQGRADRKRSKAPQPAWRMED